MVIASVCFFAQQSAEKLDSDRSAISPLDVHVSLGGDSITLGYLNSPELRKRHWRNLF
jgi:hypothetical protein